MKTASDIDREAAAWIARRDASNASNAADAVEKEFQAWIDADVRHRVAYLRLNAAWERTLIAEKLRPLDGSIDRHLLAPPAPAVRRRFVPWLPAFAALVLLAIGLVGWFVVDRGDVYETGVGHFERIRLQDGSTIEINTDSELRVRMTAERRVVFLMRGEAHFKVAHDSERPFEVEVGGTRVRAVGTAFSVRHDRRYTEVLVTEGRVVVAPVELNLQDVSMSMPGISAGELAVVEPQGLNIQPVQPEAIARRLSWTEGKLVFHEETLARAVAEFNRYNHEQLVVADPSLAALHVGGSFASTDVPSFLAALDRIFGVQALPVSRGVVHLVARQSPHRRETEAGKL